MVVYGGAVRIALFALALLFSPVRADDSEVDYCHDPDVNQQWGKLIDETPGDGILVRLFALRLRLCQLVDSGQLDLDRATEIFEQARREAAMGRRRGEQDRRLDQRTGT